MLTPGQTALDFKRRYIRQNQANSALHPEVSLPDSYQPQTPPRASPNPQSQPLSDHQKRYEEGLDEKLYDRFPQDQFKMVQNKLKLNQSAMLPGGHSQRLDDLARGSDSILLKVSTFWPFTFFVHDIIIDPYKVNIIFREFFWSEQIHSVMVKDILDVVVETSIFFATVRIVDQGYIENAIDIHYLKRGDALKVRKIIQGLVIAHRQAVDLSVLSSTHIREKVEELGQVKGIDKPVTNPTL